jgi:hypothetical protein
MNLPKIFSNRQFKWVAIAVAIVILVLVIMNIFVIGGDLFIYTFNSSLNAPLAIFVAVSAATIWFLMRAGEHSRILWLGIFIGWGSWAIAETIWAVYSILGQEVPYPSLADIFWVIGYIPMGFGLITRIRTTPARPNRSQNLYIIVASAATILVTTIYIFIPIIQSFDPQLLIESILNFIYPLADLFLVIIVWRLFFTYEEGDYGFVWRLLSLGFILMAVSDFVFTYTTWQGLYYPDMQANLVSRLVVDVPYSVSYLLWFAGIYALSILLREKPPVEPGTRIRMVRTYGHILVYTKSDDTVIDVSPNFHHFFSTGDVRGKSLAEALAISEQDAGSILEKIRKDGRVADLPLQLRDSSGALREISVSGLQAGSPKNEYSGSNLLLRMRVAGTSFDESLSRESRSLARHLLQHSGNNYKSEIGQFLSDYYLSFIRCLLDMVFHQGGEKLSQALLDRLQETAKEHNWQMQFNLQTVMDSQDYPLEVLREALPILLETARRFVSDALDPVIVETRMKELSSRFGETIHRDVAFYGKTDGEIGFSDHRKEIPTRPR